MNKFLFPKQKFKAVDVKTLVYPGFPTDFNNLSVLLTQATGSCVVTDTIYSARFKHIDELRRMNANDQSRRKFSHYYWSSSTYKEQRLMQVIYEQEQHLLLQD